MHFHFKNSLSALLISTAIIACGGGSGSSNSSSTGSTSSSQSITATNIESSRTNDIKSAPSGIALQNKSVGDGSTSNESSSDRPALTDLSIADGLIRPEVVSLSSSGLTKIIDNPNYSLGAHLGQIQAIREKLQEMDLLLKTSTNQQERDLLAINKELFSKRLRFLTGRSSEMKQSEESINTQKKLFIQKYIQSTQLRSLMLQFQALTQEKLELETHPEKVSDLAANESKAAALSKRLVDLYNDPNLDEQTRKEFEAIEAINLLGKSFLKEMRSYAYPERQPLSSEAPDLARDVSLRRARNQEPHADFSQLMVNGVSGGYAPLSMPVYLQLKGTIEGSKETTGLTGLVVYKLNNTLVGIIHGYANASINRLTPLNHNESSVVVSHSFGKAYLEGQAGFVRSSINQHDVSGDRYKLAAGYDFEYVTPFVQASVRNLNGLNEHSVQAGCEVDIVNLVTDQYTLSTRMTLKGGYHSFKGTVGSIEGSFELGFNNGVHIQTGFKASSKEASTAQISLSFDQ